MEPSFIHSSAHNAFKSYTMAPNIAGAFLRPNGIRKYMFFLPWGAKNVFFNIDSGDTRFDDTQNAH